MCTTTFFCGLLLLQSNGLVNIGPLHRYTAPAPRETTLYTISRSNIQHFTYRGTSGRVGLVDDNTLIDTTARKGLCVRIWFDIVLKIHEL